MPLGNFKSWNLAEICILLDNKARKSSGTKVLEPFLVLLPAHQQATGGGKNSVSRRGIVKRQSIHSSITLEPSVKMGRTGEQNDACVAAILAKRASASSKAIPTMQARIVSSRSPSCLSPVVD